MKWPSIRRSKATSGKIQRELPKAARPAFDHVWGSSASAIYAIRERDTPISNAASFRAACEPAPLACPQAPPALGVVRYAALRSASALSAQVGRRACQAL